ncbi:MAG: DNA-directed RNA polymerase subunit omega [Clostridium sp.]
MSNSMINPSIIDLLEKVEDRYSLVIVTSKRARQLIEGKEKLIKEDFRKSLTIAINEVQQGAVKYHKETEE